VNRPEIADIFRRARVGLLLLHPERNFLISYPTKLFEYMSAGIPVVASDFPIFRELDDGIGCCTFVDPLDPEAAAAAILHLLDHPAEAEEMGLRGFNAVREKYSWESEARTLRMLYDDILRTTARTS
jgi:glycosyltransferase involved in cell wall biosynthesis